MKCCGPTELWMSSLSSWWHYIIYLFLFYRHSHWTENKYKTKGLKCCHLVFLLVRKGNYVSVNHHYGPEAQSTVWVFSSDLTRDQKIGTAGDARLLSSETGLREVTSYDPQESRAREEDEVQIDLSHTFNALTMAQSEEIQCKVWKMIFTIMWYQKRNRTFVKNWFAVWQVEVKYYYRMKSNL